MVFDNKKIAYTAIIIGTIIIVGMLFVLLRLNNSGSSSANGYTINFSVHDGAVKATLVQGKKTSDLSSEEAGKYASTSFNSTKDIFWAGCADGYKTASVDSPSGNNTINDPVLGVGLDVISGKDNQLSLTCIKQ